MTHAHVSAARVLHDAGHVSKVEVDEAGILDEVGNAGDGLAQHIVRDLEGVGQRDLLVSGVFQAVIGDDQQRIDLAEQLLDAGLGLIHTALALKLEGLGHHADREAAGLACDIGDRGGRAGTGAAAHAGGNEHHIGVLDGLGDVVAALLRGALADLRIGAGALTVGHLLADLHLLVGIGDRKGLLVRIYRNKLDTLGAGFYHSVHNVVAGAADADHFQRHNIFGPGLSFEIHFIASLYIFSSEALRYA